MRRWVTFRSARFEHRTPGPHFINPDCFGEDVVAWLRPALEAAGLQPGEPVQEDYGWGVWVDAGGDPYWVAVAVIEDADADAERGPGAGDDEAEWAVGIAYEPGFSLGKRLFHRPRESDLLAVARAVDGRLRGDPAIHSMAWWGESPHQGTPAATPDAEGGR